MVIECIHSVDDALSKSLAEPAPSNITNDTQQDLRADFRHRNLEPSVYADFAKRMSHERCGPQCHPGPSGAFRVSG